MFRTKDDQDDHQTLYINGESVETVASFRFFGTHSSQDLIWAITVIQTYWLRRHNSDSTSWGLSGESICHDTYR